MIPELRGVSFYFVMTLCVRGLGRAGLGLSHLRLWCSHGLEVSQGGSPLGAQLAEMSQRVTHVAALETGCWLGMELGLSLWMLPKMPLQCVLSQCSRTSSMIWLPSKRAPGKRMRQKAQPFMMWLRKSWRLLYYTLFVKAVASSFQCQEC